MLEWLSLTLKNLISIAKITKLLTPTNRNHRYTYTPDRLTSPKAKNKYSITILLGRAVQSVLVLFSLRLLTSLPRIFCLYSSYTMFLFQLQPQTEKKITSGSVFILFLHVMYNYITRSLHDCWPLFLFPFPYSFLNLNSGLNWIKTALAKERTTFTYHHR